MLVQRPSMATSRKGLKSPVKGPPPLGKGSTKPNSWTTTHPARPNGKGVEQFLAILTTKELVSACDALIHRSRPQGRLWSLQRGRTLRER